MNKKPTLHLVYTIALLCPVVSAAACLDSNDPAKYMTTGDCHYKAEYFIADLAESVSNQPASEQKTVNQSGLSAFEGFEASDDSSRGGVKKSPKTNKPDLDNFDWIPPDWYEVY